MRASKRRQLEEGFADVDRQAELRKAREDRIAARLETRVEAQRFEAERELFSAAFAYASVAQLKERLAAMKRPGQKSQEGETPQLWFPLNPNIKTIFLLNASRGAKFERELIDRRLAELQDKDTLTEVEYAELAELQVVLEPLSD